jgi:hypothetical protein
MRRSAPLSREIETRLRAYALAAAGSGIGLLALVQPSEAEIVYTPADVTITNRRGATYNLDLNGDGITDFVLGGGIDATTFYVRGLKGNELLGHRSAGSSVCYASALKEGRIIGSGDPLRWCVDFVLDELVPGFWRNVRDRYLGFKFKVDNEIYYGWARLGVSVNGSRVTAHLTGYAYESVPDKPIKAGQTSETEATDAARPEDANSGDGALREGLEADSLGALALGSSQSRRLKKACGQFQGGC